MNCLNISFSLVLLSFLSTNLLHKCVCSDYFTYQPFTSLSSSPWASYSPRYNNIKIRPINNPAMASKNWSERKSCTFEIATKNLDYYTNLVDKAVDELERIDFNFESSTVSKILSDSIICYREIEKGKVNYT